MITHPSAEELGDAVAAFAARNAEAGDARGAFLARVADNARGLLAREAEHGARLEAEAVSRLCALLGRSGDFATLNAALCDALRDGVIAPLDPMLLDHLRATAIGQIAIDQPAYGGLEALRDGGG